MLQGMRTSLSPASAIRPLRIDHEDSSNGLSSLVPCSPFPLPSSLPIGCCLHVTFVLPYRVAHEENLFVARLPSIHFTEAVLSHLNSKPYPPEVSTTCKPLCLDGTILPAMEWQGEAFSIRSLWGGRAPKAASVMKKPLPSFHSAVLSVSSILPSELDALA